MTFGEAKGVKIGTVLYYKGNGNPLKVVGKQEDKDKKEVYFTGTWPDGGFAVVHHRTVMGTKQRATRGKVVPDSAIIRG